MFKTYVSLPVLVILCALALVDFITRVIPSTPNLNSAISITGNHDKFIIPDNIIMDIQAWHSSMGQIDVAEDITSVGDSGINEDEQSGTVQSLWIDNNRYRLLAVSKFQTNDFVAVVEKVTEGQAIDKVQLKENDTLGKYRVTAISLNKVVLQYESRKIELVMFIPNT